MESTSRALTDANITMVSSEVFSSLYITKHIVIYNTIRVQVELMSTYEN